jgi:ABC-2 type transport system permease protein
MIKTWLVLKHEIITYLTRPAFLFTIFGLPILSLSIYAIYAWVGQNNASQEVVSDFSGMITNLSTDPTNIQTAGYVDHSGLIQAIPATILDGTFIAYPDETSARQALAAGYISAYYVISADYMQSGAVSYVRPKSDTIPSLSQMRLFEQVLKANLLGGDSRLASLLDGPLTVNKISLAPQSQRDLDNPLAIGLPVGVTIYFYLMITSSAGLLLNAVTKEKANRTMEILMLSLTPNQFMTGKIIGLGLLSILQTAIWLGIGRFLFSSGASVLNITSEYQLSVSFFIWGVVFFVLGYVVYASLLAGLGALAAHLGEAYWTSTILTSPLFFSTLLVTILGEDLHHPILVVLSLFPLTAPTVMMARLTTNTVPWWQTALAISLLLGTIILVVRASAGMFRAQTLVSGQPFKIKTYFLALFGR